MRIALYQPEIAGNVGAILRLAACFSVPVDIIMPMGFAFSDAKLKRAAMDYGAAADVTRHANFEAFDEFRRAEGRRLVLMSSHASQPLPEVRFQSNDILLMGSGHGRPARANPDGGGVPVLEHRRFHGHRGCRSPSPDWPVSTMIEISR